MRIATTASRRIPRIQATPVASGLMPWAPA
jgi:hypothetical protein